MASAAKRADRETTEGVVLVPADDDHGDDRRRRLRDRAGLEERGLPRVRPAMCSRVHESGEDAVDGSRSGASSSPRKLGENIQVVGARRIEAADGESFVSYVHPPANKVGVLVEHEGRHRPTLARQLAMHISFSRPTYRTRDEVPAELVDAEREILEKLPEVESKPEDVRDEDRRRDAEQALLRGVGARASRRGSTTRASPYARRCEQGGLELVEYAWLSVG